MSEVNNDQPVADVTDESVTAPVATEPTLRARISAWLAKRPLSSVIVASVLALFVGIGIGHISTMHHERDGFGMHQFGPDRENDGRGPGMMGPGNGQFGPGNGNGQGGPGMMGPGNGQFGPGNGPDDRGPGSGPGQNGQIPPLPLPSASPATN